MLRGETLQQAFFYTLRERGAAAAFTAVTMSLGVGSWTFSALRFQADMGLVLSFMFLVNMLGALVLLLALVAAQSPAGVGRRSSRSRSSQ